MLFTAVAEKNTEDCEGGNNMRLSEHESQKQKKNEKKTLSAPPLQCQDLNEWRDKRNVEQTWVVFKTTYK